MFRQPSQGRSAFEFIAAEQARQQDAIEVVVFAQRRDKIHGRLVGPLQIIQHEHERSGRRGHEADEPHEKFGQPALRFAWIEGRRRREFAREQRQLRQQFQQRASIRTEAGRQSRTQFAQHFLALARQQG